MSPPTSLASSSSSGPTTPRGAFAGDGFDGDPRDDGPSGPPRLHLHAPAALYGQFFESDGTADAPFRVDDMFDIVGNAEVALNGTGSFIVTWTGTSDPAQFDPDAGLINTVIGARLYDSAGDDQLWQVNEDFGSIVHDPSVDLTSDGRFALTWTELVGHPDGGEHGAIWAAVFESDGSQMKEAAPVTEIDRPDLSMSNEFASVSLSDNGQVAIGFTTFIAGEDSGDGLPDDARGR